MKKDLTPIPYVHMDAASIAKRAADPMTPSLEEGIRDCLAGRVSAPRTLAQFHADERRSKRMRAVWRQRKAKRMR